LTINRDSVKFNQFGGVAQLVRACGSYPQCPGFKSLHRHQSLSKETRLKVTNPFLFHLHLIRNSPRWIWYHFLGNSVPLSMANSGLTEASNEGSPWCPSKWTIFVHILRFCSIGSCQECEKTLKSEDKNLFIAWHTKCIKTLRNV
jgi:hypothetical protein